MGSDSGSDSPTFDECMDCRNVGIRWKYLGNGKTIRIRCDCGHVGEKCLCGHGYAEHAQSEEKVEVGGCHLCHCNAFISQKDQQGEPDQPEVKHYHTDRGTIHMMVERGPDQPDTPAPTKYERAKKAYSVLNEQEDNDDATQDVADTAQGVGEPVHGSADETDVGVADAELRQIADVLEDWFTDLGLDIGPTSEGWFSVAQRIKALYAEREKELQESLNLLCRDLEELKDRYSDLHLRAIIDKALNHGKGDNDQRTDG